VGPFFLVETKTLPLTEAKVAGQGSGTLEGYASAFGSVDSYGDTVEPGAYAETIPAFLRDGFIAWGHDWRDPVALPTLAREDARGLFIQARFHSHPEAQRARSITAERLAAGKSMGLSIGYEALEWEFRQAERMVRGPAGGGAHQVRVLKKIKLYEVSLVTVPAEPRAGVLDAKAAEAKPMEGVHACRLRDPGDFQDGTFRTMSRRHEGKPYNVILGRLKGETTLTEQAYRYRTEDWTAAEARAHCGEHDGTFEAAKAAPASGAGTGCAGTGGAAFKREWDVAYQNDLPDSAFAAILPGGEKDEEGKTVPRALRKLPHHDKGGDVDLPHLRNALARLPQADLPEAAAARAGRHLERHAAEEGVGERGRALHDLEHAVGDLVAETKVGRPISAARRERIGAWRDSLRGLADELDDLLTETAPPSPDGKRLYLEFQRTLARLHGAVV
jgi:HK97 family phage prohead protease